MTMPAQVAMPRAYWLGFENRILSSQLMLLKPSKYEFAHNMKAMEESGQQDFDMDILNTLYKDSAMILPHRPYDLLTGEFRGTEHSKYIGDEQQEWDPDTILREAKYLHFSDWPLPKVRFSVSCLASLRSLIPSIAMAGQSSAGRKRETRLHCRRCYKFDQLS